MYPILKVRNAEEARELARLWNELRSKDDKFSYNMEEKDFFNNGNPYPVILGKYGNAYALYAAPVDTKKSYLSICNSPAHFIRSAKRAVKNL